MYHVVVGGGQPIRNIEDKKGKYPSRKKANVNQHLSCRGSSVDTPFIYNLQKPTYHLQEPATQNFRRLSARPHADEQLQDRSRDLVEY